MKAAWRRWRNPPEIGIVRRPPRNRYGSDLSNRVEYVGEPGADGGYRPIESCTPWRRAINRLGLEFLVVTPASQIGPGSIPQESVWTSGDPGAEEILRASPASVFQISGPSSRATAKPKTFRPSSTSPAAASQFRASARCPCRGTIDVL